MASSRIACLYLYSMGFFLLCGRTNWRNGGPRLLSLLLGLLVAIP